MNEGKDKDKNKDVTISAPLPGDGGGLIKAGGPALDLTSAYTHEGTTYIECGTLLVRDPAAAPAVDLAGDPDRGPGACP